MNGLVVDAAAALALVPISIAAILLSSPSFSSMSIFIRRCARSAPLLPPSPAILFLIDRGRVHGTISLLSWPSGSLTMSSWLSMVCEVSTCRMCVSAYTSQQCIGFNSRARGNRELCNNDKFTGWRETRPILHK